MSKRVENGYAALALMAMACFVAIAFVSWSTSYSKGYHRANQDSKSVYSDGLRAEIHYKECMSKSTTIEALECYRDAEYDSEEEQRANQDLNAQREMADWAESVLWATILIGAATVIVTTIGIYFVRETLTVSNQTNEAAISAARSANEANRILRAERRPWVTLRRDTECDFFESDRGFSVAWNHDFENLGRSPAYDLRLRTKAIKTGSLLGLREMISHFVESETKTRTRL